jgi:hypothetical protein
LVLVFINSSSTIGYMGTSFSGERGELEVIPFGRALDKLWALGGRVLRLCPNDPPMCQSDHYRPPEPSETGAEAMLASDPYVSPGSYYFRADLEPPATELTE